MRRFWETLETIGASLPGGGPIEKWASPAMAKAIDTMEKELRAAESQAIESPYRDRLRLIRATVQELLVQSRDKYVTISRHPIPSLQAHRIATALQVDGKLDESAWQSATATANFVHMDGGPSEVNTTVKAMCDDTTLYLGFDCQEPNMDKLTLNQRIPSAGLCTDDSVEVMVGSTNIVKDGFLQIMLTADGIYIAMWPKKQGHRTLADLGVRGAAHRGTAGWTAEMEIPLRHFFDAEAQARDVLKAGLYRNRCVFGNHWKFATKMDSERWLCWSPTFVWSFNNPARFGTISLMPPK
ncbi:MAG: carbohydrate-binding family 9-like protein [Kiritimatiellae bacterium]|nr:carbohydrate-binding family 9-like protein [Kiritimatiellia bacterium]